MRKSCTYLVLVAFVSLLALVVAAFAQDPPANTAPDPSQAKAKVVFYYARPVPMKDCLTQVGILIDGVNVHQIGQWHVWQTELTPGTHTFMDDTQKDTKGETGTFQAGQTYYYELFFRAKPGFLINCGRFYNKFEPIKPNSKEYRNAISLVGKPGADETVLSSAVAPGPAKAATVKLAIVSTPDAADIEVDGSFMGNTPSAIELTPGEHAIVVTKNGYKPWQRKIKLAPGDIKLNAQLETDTAQR